MVRLNVAALSRGIAVGSMHLLTVAGRVSGEPHTTPVSLATVNGVRYIVAAFPQADWVKNARAAKTGDLFRGSRRERVDLVELPPAERGPVLRAFLEQVRGGRRFFNEMAPEEVVANAANYPVFMVEPRENVKEIPPC
jgi:deazaflavin-dependent oxidoreductase (nitroreductase family)